MYLANLKLWNFRKFGSSEEFNLDNPHLNLCFSKGLNVLIGANDSGKSAIIDAIKIVLNTHSYEWIKIADEDFYEGSTRFRIELRFEDMADDEAKNFAEWIGWTGKGDALETYLRLIYDAKRNSDKIFPSETKAGVDNEGSALNTEAREYLKTTYLKPMRDAKADLIPRKNSRLSQIFQSHEAFTGNEDEHYLFKLFAKFNAAIEKYFEARTEDGNKLENDVRGLELKNEIDGYIQKFYEATKKTEIGVAEASLKKILEKLELFIKDDVNPGLGTLNRLYMAAELLHLKKKNWNGLRLGLIEELEAHLHPQAQMQIIEAFQQESEIQLILSTHSPNLASKVNLNSLIICNGANAYPMGSNYTRLKKDDYIFLKWFLDVTKANLFFAKGLIFVEGWSEEIFLPAFAKKLKKIGIISKDFTEAGVSIINVGSTAFFRYSRIFLRKNGPDLVLPIAIITDSDAAEYEMISIKNDDQITYEINPKDQANIEVKKKKAIKRLEKCYNRGKIKTFIAPNWTFEYSLFKSETIGEKYKEIIRQVHPRINAINIEKSLAEKLIKRRFKKTDAAYRLAKALENDCELSIPEININEDDVYIKYLIEAIKYVCSN
jgi:putative ATP-dependent endonuclease of OLD family